MMVEVGRSYSKIRFQGMNKKEDLNKMENDDLTEKKAENYSYKEKKYLLQCCQIMYARDNDLSIKVP